MTPRHLYRVDWAPDARWPPNLEGWPFTIPAVKQLIKEGGLDLAPGVTFLLGENGSGKSTLLEAIADKYDMKRKGHATPYAHVTGPSGSAEDSPLSRHITLDCDRRASPAGFFLRAEMMHQFLTEVDASDEAQSWGGKRMQARSHGESFIEVLRHRFDEPGVYFLDEPESALSFRSCLGLVALLDVMRSEGSQVIVATHSPILASLPNATLLQLDENGLARVEHYDELGLVADWRNFLGSPQRFLKHLVKARDDR